VTRNPLLWSASAAVLIVAAGIWMVCTEAATALRQVGQAAQDFTPRVMRSVDGALNDVNARTQEAIGRTDARTAEALATVRSLAATATQQIASIQQDARQTAQDATGQIQGMRQDLAPVLANAASLEARYTALPDQLGEVFKPTWASLEPELTCRHSDGSGYGGCWHSRITGIMGEAVNVGGVFTQQFPSFVTTFQETNKSVAGIAGNFNSITAAVDRKYFNPPPKTKWKRALDAFETWTPLFVIAAVRAGAI